MAKNKAVRRRIRRGRPIHKKILLHPIVWLLMLCLGIVLLGTTLSTSAVDIAVVAKVPAPIPAAPAKVEIIQPASNPAQQQAAPQGTTSQNPVVVKTNQIVLSGSCPKASRLEFYRNNVFAGATPCIGDPTFSIQLDLAQGLNVIVAHVFNITDDEGPVSLPLYINYSAPVLAGSLMKHNQPAPPDFILSSDFSHLGFLTNQQGNWDVRVVSGTPPFNFKVDWGDGTSTNYSQPNLGVFTISHTYTKASGSTGYIIAISGSDGVGKRAEL